MSRYINADKLEKDGWNMQRIRQASPTEMVYETKKPTDFPVADVVEVRRGKWIELRPFKNIYTCSLCERWGEYHWNYCPHCGAKMMNEDEEMSKVSEMEMAYGEYLND